LLCDEIFTKESNFYRGINFFTTARILFFCQGNIFYQGNIFLLMNDIVLLKCFSKLKNFIQRLHTWLKELTSGGVPNERTNERVVGLVSDVAAGGGLSNRGSFTAPASSGGRR
jgi:hypothetical protein